MKIHVHRMVVYSFLLAVTVLVTLAIFSFINVQNLIDTTRMLSHSTRIIAKSEETIKAIIDVETSVRGYVITTDSSYLQPYFDALKVLPAKLLALDSMMMVETPHENHKNELRQLHHLIERRLKIAETRILAANQNFELARELIIQKDGRNVMDSIRAYVKAMQDKERIFFRSNSGVSSEYLKQFQISLLGLVGFVLVIVTILFFVINRQIHNEKEIVLSRINDSVISINKEWRYTYLNDAALSTHPSGRKEIINKVIWDVHPELVGTPFQEKYKLAMESGKVQELEEFYAPLGIWFYAKVYPSSDGLTLFYRDVTQKKKIEADLLASEAMLAELNTNLEKKVQERTRQLALANQELDAFSYSVSHDLRAPLRSIDGYARILEEEYASKLDDEGRRLIETITRNANRMGRLIDDMLNLSRLGRIEASLAQISMYDVVTKIVTELVELEQERQIDIQIQDLLPAQADLDMIRQVWVNLISNALKYSSKKARSEIQIGSNQVDDEVCYYIKDNGTGFDQRYAHKLFGVFQRLHKQHEFDGTGVGLAICKRIIERHGGRIWATGEPGQGATFYFSLRQI
jgi:signal transduction histidine kinase